MQTASGGAGVPAEWFGQVQAPYWEKKALAIVATGPSLKGFDFRRFQIPEVRTLAVKEAIWDLPFADAVFALHTPWMKLMAGRLRALTCEVYLAVEPQLKDVPHIANAIYLDRSRFEGLSDDHKVIQSGGNSGFGAFNLAYLKRARKIALFGFDYLENGTVGHHFRDSQYAWYSAGQNERYWKNWGDNFTGCLAQLRKAGISVLNASPISTVTAFPKASIDEGLEWLAR